MTDVVAFCTQLTAAASHLKKKKKKLIKKTLL